MTQQSTNSSPQDFKQIKCIKSNVLRQQTNQCRLLIQLLRTKAAAAGADGFCPACL